jgi:hypothetical protein
MKSLRLILDALIILLLVLVIALWARERDLTKRVNQISQQMEKR